MDLLVNAQNLVHILVDVIRRLNLHLGLALWYSCLCHEDSEPTAAARSSIARPAIKASSWLSLISMLMICTGLLNSPPRFSKSIRWSKLTRRRQVVKRTVANSVVTSLLTSNNNIGDLLTFLPPFGRQFDLPVPVKHLKQTASGVPTTEISTQL